MPQVTGVFVPGWQGAWPEVRHRVPCVHNRDPCQHSDECAAQVECMPFFFFTVVCGTHFYRAFPGVSSLHRGKGEG